jgi:hypothetical protein
VTDRGREAREERSGVHTVLAKEEERGGGVSGVSGTLLKGSGRSRGQGGIHAAEWTWGGLARDPVVTAGRQGPRPVGSGGWWRRGVARARAHSDRGE